MRWERGREAARARAPLRATLEPPSLLSLFSYPVYVDSSVIMGMTGPHNGTGFDGISYLKCDAANGFFPDLSKAPRTDLIFFCSPQQPHGCGRDAGAAGRIGRVCQEEREHHRVRRG